MSEEIIHDIKLAPGKKTRIPLGDYDVESMRPRFKIRISPLHVKDLVEYEEVLIGDRSNCQVAYDVHNKSSMLAFIEIVKIND
ncbi:MAG TPA: hypothetical protein VMW09_01755 [Desulfatiglandales bacterium]|nr:hypothetical protein [Desulfatiglandales bacterium]